MIIQARGFRIAISVCLDKALTIRQNQFFGKALRRIEVGARGG
jgi:hypothetical protein